MYQRSPLTPLALFLILLAILSIIWLVRNR
jgi:hypothetical protein